MKRKLAIIAVVLGVVCSLSSTAFAAPFKIGKIVDAVPFGAADLTIYMNTFLQSNLQINTPTLIGTETYTAFLNPLPGSGSVSSSSGAANVSLSIPAGWEYLIAKYDGQNAGAVVWYLGGEAGTIPNNDPIFSTTRYGLSGWVAFNGASVPDGGATLMLLGSALFGLAVLRRKFGKN